MNQDSKNFALPPPPLKGEWLGFFGLFRNRSLFSNVSLVSKHVHNTENNQKIVWFRETNQKSTETDLV
jgi:hypothetical protein